MASPSSVPSAADIAATASAKYELIVGEKPPNDSLEKLVHYLLTKNQLALFLNKLVDWAPFRSQPNAGHAAIADFLACGVFDSGLTTNVDELVELAAKALGEADFLSTISAEDLTFARPHRPLVKLHGCIARERQNTIWCVSQLSGPLQMAILKKRVEFFANWLAARLFGKHLILVGFWSDWDYLNQVLQEAIRSIQPPLVVVVDPKEDDKLKYKAPDLWAWANASGVDFNRVRCSGADFLDELRNRFSRRFLERLLADSASDYRAATGRTAIPPMDFPTPMSTDEFYDLRRDATGAGPGTAVRAKRPSLEMRAVGVAHLILRDKGIPQSGTRYKSDTLGTIRIVMGSGRPISAVRKEFAKDAVNATDELVVCAWLLR